jgi:hypothetical protein
MILKEVYLAQQMHYPGIFLEEAKKTTINLSQNVLARIRTGTS